MQGGGPNQEAMFGGNALSWTKPESTRWYQAQGLGLFVLGSLAVGVIAYGIINL